MPIHRVIRSAAICLAMVLAVASAPLAAIDNLECVPGHIISGTIDGRPYSACVGLEEPTDCLKCYVSIEVP